jgi:hypothetical protein
VAQYIGDMDAHKAFANLCADATSEVVAQINEFRMEDTLCEKDAGPDKWSNGLEAFLDSFVIKLSQLNDTRSTPVADRESQAWLIQALRNHEGAMGIVSPMQQLDLRDKRMNPGHKMTFKDWVEGLWVSFQQWDKVNKPQPWTKVKPPNERRVNKNERGGPPYREKGTCQPMDDTTQAKFQEKLKAMGMWIEPDVFKRVTGEQRKAHNEKVRTMRKAKKSESTPVVPASTQAPATAPVPETYAMAAAQQPLQKPQKLDQALESQFPNGAPRVFTYKGVTYRAAGANRTYEARTKLSTSGSLVDSGCNGGVAGNDVLILEEHSYGEVDIIGVGNNMIRGVALQQA